MRTFGDILKSERELRGISIEELHNRTKISIKFLQALEEENFSLLPPEAITKGFIISICETLGIDCQNMLNEYQHSKARDEIIKSEEKKGVKKSLYKKKILSFLFNCLIFLLIGLIIGITFYIYNRNTEKNRGPYNLDTNVNSIFQNGNPDENLALQREIAELTKQNILIRLIATQPVLVSAIIDNSVHREHKLEAGEGIKLGARKKIALTVSDDRKIKLFIREKPFPINNPKGGINTFIFDENIVNLSVEF